MSRWNVTGSVRVERFRARNRVGDRVSGSFLGWEGQELGWVDFQGTPLLARMVSRPDIGSRLYFLVKQLSPEIVLQELLPCNLPDGYALLQRFWTLQTLTETILSAMWPSTIPGGDDARVRIAVFRELMTHSPELKRAYANLGEALQPVNSVLLARGKGRFFPMPWLIDRVQNAGLLLTSPDSAIAIPEVHFGCTHARLGRLEIHFFLPPGRRGWFLYLEAAAPRTWSTSLLRECIAGPALERLPFLGIKPLPDDARSGILDRLLLDHEPGRFRLHLRV